MTQYAALVKQARYIREEEFKNDRNYDVRMQTVLHQTGEKKHMFRIGVSHYLSN
jgi:hypothetical protein